MSNETLIHYMVWILLLFPYIYTRADMGAFDKSIRKVCSANPFWVSLFPVRVLWVPQLDRQFRQGERDDRIGRF